MESQTVHRVPFIGFPMSFAVAFKQAFSIAARPRLQRANGIPLHREVVDRMKNCTDGFGLACLETL